MVAHKQKGCEYDDMKDCRSCGGLFRDRFKEKHNCIKFVLNVLKEAVGHSAFDLATAKVREAARLSGLSALTARPKLPETQSGTLESILSQQIKSFEGTMQNNLTSFLERSKLAETQL